MDRGGVCQEPGALGVDLLGFGFYCVKTTNPVTNSNENSGWILSVSSPFEC
jgi:hypothetical protein